MRGCDVIPLSQSSIGKSYSRRDGVVVKIENFELVGDQLRFICSDAYRRDTSGSVQRGEHWADLVGEADG